MKIDLDIDFIGGHGSLTAAEEKALSDFFRQRKLKTKSVKPLKSKQKSVDLSLQLA